MRRISRIWPAAACAAVLGTAGLVAQDDALTAEGARRFTSA